jgi:hypothetical protein
MKTNKPQWAKELRENISLMYWNESCTAKDISDYVEEFYADKVKEIDSLAKPLPKKDPYFSKERNYNQGLYDSISILRGDK